MAVEDLRQPRDCVLVLVLVLVLAAFPSSA
jgi:hypothetical protein